jgi:hypothetical protein
MPSHEPCNSSAAPCFLQRVHEACKGMAAPVASVSSVGVFVKLTSDLCAGFTRSAHPARFTPEDKYSRQRVTLKQRYGLLPRTVGKK